MKYSLRKFTKAILVEALLLLLIIAITPVSMAEEQPRYGTESGLMEIIADAPWRVSSPTATIPIEVVLKDAYITDDSGTHPVQLDSIKIYDVKTGAEKKTGTSVPAEYLGGYWERVLTSLRASDFLKDDNNYINIKVEINYRWYLAHDTFTQYLRVWVGSSLPSLPNWYGGDTHYHSEYTGDIHYDDVDCSSAPEEVTEFGGSLKGTVYAARAIGLDWTCVTDHAYYLDDGTWDEYVQAVNNIREDFGFNMILGEEVSPRGMGSDCSWYDFLWCNDDCTVHLLAFGTNGNYIYGDEHNHWPCDEHEYNIAHVLDQVRVHGGFAFGAHPFHSFGCGFFEDLISHLWKEWDSDDYSAGLNSSSLAGFQFWNRRDTMSSDIGIGDAWPDVICAPPLSGDFNECGHTTSYNPNWDEELLKGVEKWDELNSGFRRIFMIGGSDAHGHFNYEVNASWNTLDANDISINNNAFGKVRTYVFCPSGNTEKNVLNALKNGHSIVTDGPLVIFGMDKNRDGDIDDAVDVIIGEEYQLAEEEAPRFLIKWKSTEELGRIKYIDIKRGKEGDAVATTTTVQRLATCAYCHVDGEIVNECTSDVCAVPPPTTSISNDGLSGSFEFTDSTADKYCTNYLYRIEAYTTDRPEYSPYYRNCRVYTNPIWVFKPPSNNLAGWVIESGSSSPILPKLDDGPPEPPEPPDDPPPGTIIPWVWMAFTKVSGPGPEPTRSGMSTGESGVWWGWGCIPAGTTYRVTPSKAGYTFNPPYFEFNRNTIPAEDVIFEGTESTTTSTTTTTTFVFPSITLPTKPPASTTTVTITTTSTTTTTAVCQCPTDSTPPTGCISGRVTNLAGNPLANKKVKLKRGTTLVGTAMTGGDGCYLFTNLTDGKYKVILKCCKTCTALRQTRTITGGEHVNDVNFECR